MLGTTEIKYLELTPNLQMMCCVERIGLDSSFKAGEEWQTKRREKQAAGKEVQVYFLITASMFLGELGNWGSESQGFLYVSEFFVINVSVYL